jgi:hypothetical protein
MHTEFSFAVLISCLAVNVVFHTKGRAWMHGREKQNAMHTIRATQVKTTVNRESEKKKKRQRKPRFLSYKTRGSTRSQRKSSHSQIHLPHPHPHNPKGFPPDCAFPPILLPPGMSFSSFSSAVHLCWSLTISCTFSAAWPDGSPT